MTSGLLLHYLLQFSHQYLDHFHMLWWDIYRVGMNQGWRQQWWLCKVNDKEIKKKKSYNYKKMLTLKPNPVNTWTITFRAEKLHFSKFDWLCIHFNAASPPPQLFIIGGIMNCHSKCSTVVKYLGLEWEGGNTTLYPGKTQPKGRGPKGECKEKMKMRWRMIHVDLYLRTNLVFSVFPAPDSPETIMDWLILRTFMSL